MWRKISFLAVTFLLVLLHHGGYGTSDKPGGLIKGFVTTDDGPLSGVQMVLQLPGAVRTGALRRICRTDRVGSYRFDGLPPGRYYIYVVRSVWVLDDTDSLNLKWVTINENEEVNVNLKMVRGAVITGNIKDTSDHSIAGGLVTATKTGGDKELPGFTADSITNDEGVFRIYGLPQGNYGLTIGRAPLGDTPEPFARLYYPGVTDAAKAGRIEIRAGQEIYLGIFTLRLSNQKRTISGKFIRAIESDSFQMRFQVSGTTKTGEGIIQKFTSEVDGRFNISSLPQGIYKMSPSLSESDSNYWSFSAIEVNVEKDDVLDLTVPVYPGIGIIGKIIIGGRKATDSDCYLAFKEGTGLDDTSQPFSTIKLGEGGSFQVRGLRRSPYVVLVIPGRIGLRIENVMSDGSMIYQGGSPLSLFFTLDLSRQIPRDLIINLTGPSS